MSREATLTVRAVLDTLLRQDWLSSDGTLNRQMFCWPPDAFAVAATVLRDSGAYLQVVRPHPYPAEDSFHIKTWESEVEACAKVWRSQLPSPASIPPPAEAVLKQIEQQISAGVRLHDLTTPSRDELRWLPWLKLMCYADQACRGVGLIQATGSLPKTGAAAYPEDSIVGAVAMSLLIEQIRSRDGDIGDDSAASNSTPYRPMTLCQNVDPSRAVVLPKMRTSQRGVTIRSLSLHLALLNGTDVEPLWLPTSEQLLGSASREPRVGSDPSRSSLTPKQIAKDAGPYNIVVLPWPFRILPKQFVPVDTPLDLLAGRPEGEDRMFKFDHDSVDSGFAADISILLQEAKERVGPIHGLVLPEMALSEKEFRKVFGEGLPENIDFLVCGVYEPPETNRDLGCNYAIVRRRFRYGGKETISTHRQEKHHRWALDPSQINTYAIGSSLKPTAVWWEAINIPRRRLCFFALDSFTAFTVLICEDLARPDPVGDAVRAIGPNFVICLLMDGPQLATRWSARYATVLADDPGSSVLTVSSLGMVTSSRTRERLHEESRVVAMWREPGSAPVEITLPRGSEAMVLSLSAHASTERSIDGRQDSGMAGTLRLAGVHRLQFARRGKADL